MPPISRAGAIATPEHHAPGRHATAACSECAATEPSQGCALGSRAGQGGYGGTRSGGRRSAHSTQRRLLGHHRRHSGAHPALEEFALVDQFAQRRKVQSGDLEPSTTVLSSLLIFRSFASSHETQAARPTLRPKLVRRSVYPDRETQASPPRPRSPRRRGQSHVHGAATVPHTGR